MEPTDTNQQQGTFKNPLNAMQPGEQVICEIKRHPIGLIGNYIFAGFFVILAAALALYVIPTYVSSTDQSQATVWAVMALVFLCIFVGLALIVMTIVYNGNRWIVTDDSLTQVLQVGLFNRQASQLSLHNLEDITVEQNGIIQSMFNYGVLRAETAGERSKFLFRYCPNPNHYAQQILLARERFMGEGSFEGKNARSSSDNSDQGGVNLNTNNQSQE